MSITELMARGCKQIAVYWGSPVNDGYGTFDYTSPEEIYCRWEDKTQILEERDGTQWVSRAEVYTLEDVDIDGLLYLGRLTDLDSDQEEDPKTIDSVWIIKRFEKTPVLGSTTKFVRKAYLTPWEM